MSIEIQTPEKCLTPDCEQVEYSRGLCSTCLGHARALIKENKTTDEWLIKNKMILPKKKKIHPYKAWFNSIRGIKNE